MSVHIDVSLRDDIYVTVTTTDKGNYKLFWTDGVANDWDETHTTIGAALSRLALLADCGESDWRRTFAYTGADHARNWVAFREDNLNT